MNAASTPFAQTAKDGAPPKLAEREECSHEKGTPLLQAKALVHEPLQAGFVEDVEGELLVREHGQGGAAGAGC
jgi:hypothetical protein